MVNEKNKHRLKIMIATGETVGVAERIIDDTSLVLLLCELFSNRLLFHRYTTPSGERKRNEAKTTKRIRQDSSMIHSDRPQSY